MTVRAVRVVLADDQSLVRAGLRVLVDSAPDLEVVGEASTGAEAVELTLDSAADVVLMDIRMPGTDGLTATRQITSDERLSEVKVLVLTTFEADENLFAALRAGASGFLGKSAEASDLQEAIRIIARGDALLSPAATRGLIARFLSGPASTVDHAHSRLAGLTDREREIMILVAGGLGNQEIGRRLGISSSTAKTHVNRTMTKLGVRDRAQLVMIAYETRLVRPGTGLL
ncbi:response regulator transcription factor [Spirillospora sp. NBC_00431]